MRAPIGVRVVLALVLAAIGIAVLQWAVSAREDDGAPKDADARRIDQPLADPVAPPLDPQLLRPARRVLLTDSISKLSPEIAPVVEILSSGLIAVRRAAPTPDRPVPPPLEVVGVVLPASDLGELTAVQRTALLDLLGAFAGGRRLSADRVGGIGVELSPAELEVLLRWVR